LLAEIFVLSLPIIIFSTHKTFLNNKITPYFIPKILADQKYPKSELRQVGASYCVMALWAFFLMITASSSFFMSFIEKIPFLLGIFFFVLPIVSAIILVIGITYLFSGFFGRGDVIKPKLESIDEAEPEHLSRYIHKLKIYNVINLACSFLLTILISIERSLNVDENGWAILLNVFLLIVFIMTLWKIRAYLAKSAKAMDLSGNKYLLSTLFSPFGIFFVYINSIVLIWKFKQQKLKQIKSKKD